MLLLRMFCLIRDVTVLGHPTYSPDLVPYDFYLFPKVKSSFKESHFLTTGKAKYERTDEGIAP